MAAGTFPARTMRATTVVDAPPGSAGKPVAAGIAAVLPSSGSADPAAGARSGRGGSARGQALLVAAIGFVLYTVYSVRRHELFQTHAYDLGIFGQGVRAYARLQLPRSLIRAPLAASGGGGYPLLGDHFSPVLALLGPVYRLVPHVEVLLVAQAALVASSAYTVTRVAAVRLRGTLDAPWAGAAIGTAYLLSWGIQRLAGFDFHEVCFALPLLCLALEAYLAERWTACAAWASVLVLVKEDMGCTVSAFGLLLLLGGRSRRLGTLLALGGPAVAALTVFVVVPHFNPGHVYGYLGGEAADGTGVAGLRSEPWTLPIRLIWPPEKLLTATVTVLPAGFLAVRSPIVLVAVPGLVLRFVADNPFYWGTKYQYSATLMPIVFFALIDALVRRERSGAACRCRRRAAAPAAVLSIALALTPFFDLAELATSGFWHTDARSRAAAHAVSLIPPGARVVAPDTLAPHLTDRDTVYVGWNGLPAPDIPRFDWVVADLTSRASRLDDPQLVRRALANGYVEVSVEGGYAVLRLGSAARR